MIEKTLEGWTAVLACRDADERNRLLDALLADDVVFHSPVVFTPQRGKTVTKLYLAAAGVGTIRVIDDDVVALSNLQRQILFGTADVGAQRSVRVVRIDPL